MSLRRSLAIATLGAVGAACSGSVELRVPAVLVANPASLAIPQGTAAVVDVTASGLDAPLRLAWRSLAPAIAALDSMPGAGPLSGAIVRGRAPGTTSIVVSVAGQPDVADTVAVTVTPPPCLDLAPSVRPNRATIAAGETVRLRAGIASCVTPTDTVAVWTSLQPAVARVDAAGLVTGVAPGVAAVRVAPRSAPNVVAVATVTVR